MALRSECKSKERCRLLAFTVAVLLQGTIGLSLPVVTRWASQTRMLHSLEANEASLKLAVSYLEFPGNPSSTVNAAERRKGKEIRADVENPDFWEIVKGIKSFTQPIADVRSPLCISWRHSSSCAALCALQVSSTHVWRIKDVY